MRVVVCSVDEESSNNDESNRRRRQSSRHLCSSRCLHQSVSPSSVMMTVGMMMIMMMMMMSMILVPVVVDAQECDAATGICDKHERCPVWRDEGECLRNNAYMTKHCPISCNLPAEAYFIKPTSEVGDEDEADRTCKDWHPNCHIWAELGECKDNAAAMIRFCPESCHKCIDDDDDEESDIEEEGDDNDEDCKDSHEQCSFWASKGECENNPNYMHLHCMKSCKTCPQSETKKVTGRHLDDDSKALLAQTTAFGIAQTAEGVQYADILTSIQATIKYMNSEETKRTVPAKILQDCQNRHELCSFWQVIGECEKNKAYMALNCAPVCQSCHLIDLDARCPKLVNAVPALQPGGLNQMFQRIIRTAPGNITDEDERRKLLEEHPEMQDMQPYTIVVHSRPSDEPVTEISAVTDKSLPPWVITFENFMTDEECEGMIQLGYKYEYKRSEDVGAKKFDGTFGSVKSEGRTSKNAWCSEHHGCRLEALPQRIHARMSAVMHIPPDNSEDLQILKYEKGEFYKTHHD
jgi:prolyl 4-hydroxylase